MNGENRYAVWVAFNKVRAHFVHNVCTFLDAFDRWKSHNYMLRATKAYTRKPIIQSKQSVKKCALVWNGK